MFKKCYIIIYEIYEWALPIGRSPVGSALINILGFVRYQGHFKCRNIKAINSILLTRWIASLFMFCTFLSSVFNSIVTLFTIKYWSNYFFLKDLRALFFLKIKLFEPFKDDNSVVYGNKLHVKSSNFSTAKVISFFYLWSFISSSISFFIYYRPKIRTFVFIFSLPYINRFFFCYKIVEYEYRKKIKIKNVYFW